VNNEQLTFIQPDSRVTFICGAAGLLLTRWGGVQTRPCRAEWELKAPRKCSSPRFPSLRHQGSRAGEPVPLAVCFFRPTGASEHPAPPLSAQACAHLMGAQLRAVSPACRAVEDSLLYPSPFLIK